MQKLCNLVRITLCDLNLPWGLEEALQTVPSFSVRVSECGDEESNVVDESWDVVGKTLEGLSSSSSLSDPESVEYKD